MSKIILLILSVLTFNNESKAFDLEDYATTFRATRDAFNKAYVEYVLNLIVMNESNLTFNFYPKGSLGMAGSKLATYPNAMDASIRRNNRAQMALDLEKLTEHPLLQEFQVKTGIARNGLNDINGYLAKYYSLQNPSIHGVLDNLRNNPDYEKLVSHVDLYRESPAPEFDREDWATRYRAKRDAFYKSLNELRLAYGPYIGAKGAYMSSVRTFYNYMDCGDHAGMTPPLEEWMNQSLNHNY